MGMRQDFNQILEEFGHDVLVASQSKQIRCSCWNERNEEADGDCPVCLGTGWTMQVRKVRTRRSNGQVAMDRSQIGTYLETDSRFFFPAEVHLAPGDLIVETEWSVSGHPVYRNSPVWEVIQSVPERWRGGDIIYYRTTVDNESTNRSIKGVRVTSRFDTAQYELIPEEGAQ